jgi:hypothetical protein
MHRRAISFVNVVGLTCAPTALAACESVVARFLQISKIQLVRAPIGRHSCAPDTTLLAHFAMAANNLAPLPNCKHKAGVVVPRWLWDSARGLAPHQALTMVTKQDKPRAPALSIEHDLLGRVADENT